MWNIVRHLSHLFSPRPAMGDPITIILPCKDQKREFLKDAIDSVARQSDPAWVLLVTIYADSPAWITDLVSGYGDERMRIVIRERPGLAGAINTCLGMTSTEFACLLLSDDRLPRHTVLTLRRTIQAAPEVDFFYSSRRHMDSTGRHRGKIMRARKQFGLDHFVKEGSPVKHLMCWRVKKSLAIGGLDERFSYASDDFDFPWSMAQAGARFQAIDACLYEYRVHHKSPRLTTHVPVREQEHILELMFAKHGATPEALRVFLERARRDYLLGDKVLSLDTEMPIANALEPVFRIDAAGALEFRHRGLSKAVGAHTIRYLRKPGPDGCKYALGLCGERDPRGLREVVLHADPRDTAKLPRDLFYDRDVMWHEQQFDRDGHFALGSFLIRGKSVHVLLCGSDLVQRISRKRELATRVSKLFDGWDYLVRNAILAYAEKCGAREIFFPKSDLVLKHKDQKRTNDPALFRRVYDDHLQKQFTVTSRGDWWRMDLASNLDRLVRPQPSTELVERGKQICLFHDVEGGYGHRDIDDPLARRADEELIERIHRMHEAEARRGIRATYNVVGALYPKLRPLLEEWGVDLGFHSFDHAIDDKKGASRQLSRCREMDYRIKGYRPPQSRLTDELTTHNLLFHNFEWLASSARSLGCTTPRLRDGYVELPVNMDDYALYRDGTSFESWQEDVLEYIERSDYAAIGLHDCYAHLWLPHYGGFLDKLLEKAKIVTLSNVANGVFLQSAEQP